MRRIPEPPPHVDPRDGITSAESIKYRKTLDILQEQLFRNASAHETTPPDDLPGLRPSIVQGFHTLEDINAFERDHYSAHYANPLDDNATTNMHIQNSNALIYWLGTINTIVNDIATLNTDNTPSNHEERNMVNMIKTLDTQLNQLSVFTHEAITPLLAFQTERVNKQGEPIMTDLLAAHFGSLQQDIRLIKRQLKSSTKPAAPIPKPITP